MRLVSRLLSIWTLSLAGLVSACGSRTSLAGFDRPSTTDGASGGGPTGIGGSPGSGASAPSGGAPSTGGVGTGGGGLDECPPGSIDDGDPRTPCTPCPPGTYAVPVDRSCEPWTECPWEQPELYPPSSTADRLCAGLQHFRQFGSYELDQAFDVVVDPQGNVYVSGFTFGSLDAENSGQADAFVRKYSPAGEVLWSHQLGSSGLDNAFRLLLDPFGRLNVLVSQTAQATLWIFDPDGTLTVEQGRPDGAVDEAVDALGSHYFTRSLRQSDGTLDIELSKLDLYGSPLWTVLLDAGETEAPAALAVLSGGDLILAGSTNGSMFRANPAGEFEAFVARFTSEGTLVWGSQFVALPHTYLSSLAVDSADRIYVVGSTSVDATSVDDGFVARLASAGTLEWVHSHGTVDADDFRDVTVDQLDRVTVVGTTWGALSGGQQGEQDGFVARILEDGSLGETIQFGTPSADQADGIAAAPDGAFFVVGMTQGGLEDVENFGSLDAYVLRVTPF